MAKSEDDHIKVYVDLSHVDCPVGGESLWAKKSGKGKAEICNIPFFAANISLGDIVKIKKDKEHGYLVTEVLEKVTHKIMLKYKKGKTEKGTRKKFAKLGEYLNKRGIKVEGMVPGFAMACFDKSLHKERVEAIIEAAPHLLKWAEDE